MEISSTPNWLKKIQEESWQAELLISGIAIYGIIQLPEIVHQFSDWLFTYLPFEDAIWGFSLLLYLYIAAAVLLISFMVHFILRAVWIALIGLQSVFPDGINEEGGTYSSYYMKLMKKDVGIKNFGIQPLDNFCSGIFAYGASMTFTMAVIGIDIILVYGLYRLLSVFISGKVLASIGFFFLILVYVFIFFMFYANTKKNKQNEKLQNRFFKTMKVLNYPLAHIFYKPIYFVNNVIFSNVQLKKYWKEIVAAMFVAVSILIVSLENSSILNFMETEQILANFSRTDRVFPECYEDYIVEKNKPILTTIIEQQQIIGSKMKIFVPVFANESEQIAATCNTFELIDSLSRAQNRERRYQHYSNCYIQYHRFFINDSLYQVDLLKHQHPHRETDGVLTYVPTTNFKEGKNILTVQKLNEPADTVYRTMRVNFWYSRKN